MSAVEAQKPAEVPVAGTSEPAPAPVVAPVVVDRIEEPTAEAPKTVGEVAAPVEEKKEEKVEAKPAEPIYNGVLGYKAPGLKNAFRYSKKHFWFGEEAVPASNLREYLRGEKPEVAHSVTAWSSQTGKGLLYFVKNAEQKEHPAGALNLAYASDLAKDGPFAFHFKLSGNKHAFEAQNAAERNGWFVAVEKAIVDAKESKEAIESSDGYKAEKEKIGKPAPLAAASASTAAPKKSIDATPKLAETEGAATTTEEPVVAPVRAGSSSSSSDEEKKAKKAKSRSASRKRASIFGGFLGKKDKTEEKVEQKKAEHKEEKEIKNDEPVAIAPVAETTTAPVITSDIPQVHEELKTEIAAAPIAAVPVEETKAEETPAVKAAEEKPKPTKRGSIFGSVFAKLSSPTQEKKEHDVIPAAAPAAKETETTTEATKPLDEAVVAAPTTLEPASEPAALKTEEPKPIETKPAVSTPSKEKEHFSFGKLFGSKDRAKSPAATDKVAEPRIDAVAPKIEDTTAPAVVEAIPAPAATTETKVEPTPVAEEKKLEETTPVKKEKKGSFLGSLGRSLSKATNKNKDSSIKKEKDTIQPTTLAEETTEAKTDAPVIEAKKEETPVAAAPAEKTIGDVVPEAVTVGEAPKSSPAVASTA